MTASRRRAVPAGLIALGLLAAFLAGWTAATRPARFDAAAYDATQLELLELNGDIARDASGAYVYNPDKQRGFPGPLDVVAKAAAELRDPFHRRGTNDHGIGYLVLYTISRFAAGFLVASLAGIAIGVAIGLSAPLQRALNPFIQVLKPISPLAWMPLLLYTVQDPTLTAILVVFMASLWPTIANTAFGVRSLRRDYAHVGRMLELSPARRILTIALPAAAPAIIAGLRISFGSALIAVVPAEMLLGELGVGYLTWIEWNNLDIAGVLFAILVVGIVGTALDWLLGQASTAVSYAE